MKRFIVPNNKRNGFFVIVDTVTKQVVAKYQAPQAALKRTEELNTYDTTVQPYSSPLFQRERNTQVERAIHLMSCTKKYLMSCYAKPHGGLTEPIYLVRSWSKAEIVRAILGIEFSN